MDDGGDMTDDDFARNWRDRDEEPDFVPDFSIAPTLAVPLPAICMASLEGVDIPPREWIVPDWIPSKAVTLLAGGGATGKSLLTQQMLTCIALGIPCLSMPASDPMPTLYLNCEDEADEMARRNRDIAAALGVPIRELVDVHTLSRAGEMGNDLGTFDDKRNFHLSSLFHQIEATAVASGARVIALDNIAHLFTGNENIRGEVTQFANACLRLAIRIDGAVLLLGHPAKAEGSEYSGSTGWENAVRARLFLCRPEPTEGKEPDPNARILTSGKVNYSAKGNAVEMAWHKGAFVLPDSLPQDVPQDPGSDAGKINGLFLDCLAESTRQRRAVSASPYSRTFAPKAFAAMPMAKKTKERDFKLAMERLLALGKIAAETELWTNPKNRHPVLGMARIG